MDTRMKKVFPAWPFQQIYNEDETEVEKSLSYVKSVYQNNDMSQYESYDKNHGIWFANTLSPIRDPSTRDVLAVCIISKDITDRIEKEKKLNDTVDLWFKDPGSVISFEIMQTARTSRVDGSLIGLSVLGKPICRDFLS